MQRALNRVMTRVQVKPWMRNWEIQIIEELLDRRRPKRCLEWGCGDSTLYFSKRLPAGASWLSVEHDAEWFTRVSERLTSAPYFSTHGTCEREDFHPRGRWRLGDVFFQPLSRAVNRLRSLPAVTLVHVPPNGFPWTDADGDGAYADLADYVNYPIHHGPFDFILVDGRARRDCLIRAHSMVTDDGVVVLHDAGRRYYHSSFSMYASQVLFPDRDHAEAGIWIGAKRPDARWDAFVVGAAPWDATVSAPVR